jgi:hypothetical protein
MIRVDPSVFHRTVVDLHHELHQACLC